jgi:hypothetical protein
MPEPKNHLTGAAFSDLELNVGLAKQIGLWLTENAGRRQCAGLKPGNTGVASYRIRPGGT